LLSITTDGVKIPLAVYKDYRFTIYGDRYSIHENIIPLKPRILKKLGPSFSKRIFEMICLNNAAIDGIDPSNIFMPYTGIRGADGFAKNEWTRLPTWQELQEKPFKMAFATAMFDFDLFDTTSFMLCGDKNKIKLTTDIVSLIIKETETDFFRVSFDKPLNAQLRWVDETFELVP
jgi:hypothetical protein